MSNIQGPLLQPDVNNDNNTTRLMKVNTLYSTIITDGIATIENGYISNLIQPTQDNQIATKEYVDNSGGGSASGPDGAIQYNDAGNFSGSADLILIDPGTVTETMEINGTLTNGTLTMSGSQFSGLTNPVNAQEAATKIYADNNTKLSMEAIEVTVPYYTGYNYTPYQMYNKIVNLVVNEVNVFTATCVDDIIPSASEMKTYLGDDFVVGKTWRTIFRLPLFNDSIVVGRTIGIPTPPEGGESEIGVTFLPPMFSVCFPPYQSRFVNYGVIYLESVVTNTTLGSEKYTTYVISNFNDIITNAQITDKGVLTPSLKLEKFIIYPVLADPVINTSSPVLYTYDNLQKVLIIRTGLTVDTSDSFVSAATFITNNDFVMGGGSFKFYIQNPTIYQLTLLPGTGWSFQTGNSGVIPANHCGEFLVNVNISGPSCMLYSLCKAPING